MTLHFPQTVKIVEVGPRDGLQNESAVVPIDIKVQLINQLSEAGFKNIEVGSFVSATRLPQMADTATVFTKITRKPGVIYSALTPNLRGMDDALKSEPDEIAIFAAASETFSQKNINCSIEESIHRFEPVIKKAQENNIKIRGYISCVLGCPYEGAIAIEKVVQLADRLYRMGCYEISLGDTIGVGTAFEAQSLAKAVSDSVPLETLAIHFHDTYGQALANIYACLEAGIHIIDSSISGLGGCPYAKGATGNVATEDVLYMLKGLNIETGIDIDKAISAGKFISNYLGKPSAAKVTQARS